jgi:hypothetical protein
MASKTNKGRGGFLDILCRIEGNAAIFKFENEQITLPITDFKALAISVDFEKVGTQVIDLNFVGIQSSVLNASSGLVISMNLTGSALDSLPLTASASATVGCNIVSIVPEKVASIPSIYVDLTVSRLGEKSIFGRSKIRLNDSDTVEENISLALPLSHRALRVTIKSAAGISPSAVGSKPRPYAVVYMIGEDGSRLSSKNIDAQTKISYNGCNPVWNEDFILTGPNGIEGVTAVRVKLKDKGTGKFMSGDLNLGQVDVPITCFVDRTVASLTLPVDPSGRMGLTTGVFDYGDINVLTELITAVDGAGLEQECHRPSPTRSRASSTPDSLSPGGVLSVQSQAGVAAVCITTFDPSASFGESTWWPCQIFTDTKQLAAKTSLKGFCKFQWDFFRIATHSEFLEDGIEANSLDLNELTSCSRTSGNGGVSSVSWSNIKSADALTENSVLLCCGSNGMSDCDILVGPCPAQKLELLCCERKQIYSARQNFIRLVECVERNGTVVSHARSTLDQLMLLQGCRASMYTAKLVEIVALWTGSSASVPSLKALIEPKPRSSSIDISDACLRVQSEIRSLRNSLSDFVLFLGCDRGEDLVAISGPNSVLSDKKMNVLDQILDIHRDAIRWILAPFLGSLSAFQKIAGQEEKTRIINFLAKESRSIQPMIRPILKLVGLDLAKEFSLVGRGIEEGLDTVFEWYATSIAIETKNWLARTLDNATVFRAEEKGQFPWDMVTSSSSPLCISSLPETFRFQLNVYFDLCNRNQERGEMNQHAPIYLNDKIASAIGNSLLLLKEEYSIALQSRHWSEGEEELLNSNILFLVSIANDSFRITTTHVEPLLQIETVSLEMSKVVSSINVAFMEIAEIAITNIVRCMFACLEDTIFQFDQLWAESKPLEVVIVTLKDYFSEVFPVLERHFSSNILQTSIEICVVRILLFFQNRAVNGKRFTQIEVDRIAEEADMIICGFRYPLLPLQLCVQNESDERSEFFTPSIERRLTYLVNMIDLLCLNTSSAEAKALFQTICKTYSKYNGEVAHKILECIIALHPLGLAQPDFVKEYKAILSTGGHATGEKSELPAEHDLYFRVFGDLQQHESQKGLSHTLKSLRKGVSNVNIMGINKSKTSRRKSEVNNLEFMRILGLQTRVLAGDDVAASVNSDGIQESVGDAPKCTEASEDCDTEIIISSLSVAGLTTASFFSASNPYIILSIGNSSQKTKVKWGCKDGSCSWEKYIYRFQISKSDLKSSKLYINVYDKERVRRKTFLGCSIVSMSPLDLRDIDSSFAIEGGTSRAASVRIKIRTTPL